jgi:multiple sugar transport system substrate-binding protein
LASASRLPGDAIIAASGDIGELVGRGLIVPLEDDAFNQAEFKRREIFDLVRLREMAWGRATVAVPLGSPQLLLAYRIDVFDKLGLAPPATWAEYQAVAERLNDPAALGEFAPVEGQSWHAAVEPLADGWAAELLLARAAAYALHHDQISPLFEYATMKPLIAGPPYVRALQELVDAAQASGFAAEPVTPQQAVQELSARRAAMAIGWPAPAAVDEALAGRLIADDTIGFAPLPGSTEAYRFATQTWEPREEGDSPHVPLLAVSGRMGAIAATTAEPNRTAGLLAWLAGPEISAVVGPHGAATTLFRASHVKSADRWTGALGPAASRRYAETLATALALPRAFPGLRLPGRSDYLAALDRAVREALAGDVPPSEALQSAAAEWDRITERLGRDTQRRANALSLGQEAL